MVASQEATGVDSGVDSGVDMETKGSVKNTAIMGMETITVRDIVLETKSTDKTIRNIVLDTNSTDKTIRDIVLTKAMVMVMVTKETDDKVFDQRRSNDGFRITDWI